MIMPIGKITEGKNIKAVVAFDVNNNKREMLTINELYEKASRDKVYGVGFKLDKNGVEKPKRINRFLWKEIPECNGKFEPVAEDKNTLILLGRYDKQNHKRYFLSDALGNLSMMNSRELKDVLKKNRVVGARLRCDDRLTMYITNIFEVDCIKKLGFNI